MAKETNEKPKSEKLKLPNMVNRVNKRAIPQMRIYWNFWCPLGTETELDSLSR